MAFLFESLHAHPNTLFVLCELKKKKKKQISSRAGPGTGLHPPTQPSFPQPSYLPTWFECSIHWILNLKPRSSLIPLNFSVFLSVSLNSMVSHQAYHPILQLLSCWLYYTVDFDSHQLELIAIFSKILTKHTQKSLVWLHPPLQ